MQIWPASRSQITGEVSKLVESLEKEAKVSQGREESIKKSLDEIKTRVVDNAPEEAKLRQLEANAKAKRNELESLQSQLESNRKRLDTRAQPVEAQIITRAAAPSLPVFPKKGQSAALVAFATFLLGAFWTITRSLFESARSWRAHHPRTRQGCSSGPRGARAVHRGRPGKGQAGRGQEGCKAGGARSTEGGGCRAQCGRGRAAIGAACAG